jgi:hypothetical protein
MDTTSDLERGHFLGGHPIVTDEALNRVRRAYERAFDEYSEAEFAINDCVRRRVMPTGEEFARKRVAQLALLDARRAVRKATRRSGRSQ